MHLTKSHKKQHQQQDYNNMITTSTSASTSSNNNNHIVNGSIAPNPTIMKAVQVFGQVQGEIPSWLEGSLIRHDSGYTEINNNNSLNTRTSQNSLNKSTSNNNNYLQKGNSSNSINSTKTSPSFSGAVEPFGNKQSIHRFTISDGKISLEQQSLERRSWKRRRQRSSASTNSTSTIMKEFGSGGSFSLDFDQKNNHQSLQHSSKLERFMVRLEQILLNSQPNICDSCNSNICYFGEQLYVVTESSSNIQRIDPDTLKVMENITISDVVPANSFTAHPHVLEDGSVLNIGNSTFSQNNKPVYHIFHTPPGRNDQESVLKDSIILASIPCRSKFHQSYYHSFGLTGDKLIFIEQPLRLNVTQSVWSRIRGKPLSTSVLKWYSNEKTLIHVISLSDGQASPVTYWTEKLFAFHHINTYEENGCIIMDVIGYDSGQFISDLAKERLNGKSSKQKSSSPKYCNPTARRYILPLNISTNCITGTNLLEESFPTTAQAIFHNSNSIQCIPEYLFNQAFEFSKINTLKNGLKYNYVFGVSSSDDVCSRKQSVPNSIVKLNVSTTESVSWSEDGKVCVSEPVYIPHPLSSCEDDGVLLVTLTNYENPEQVTLLILDAQIMDEIARVTFATDIPISRTSHGPWVPYQSPNPA